MQRDTNGASNVSCNDSGDLLVSGENKRGGGVGLVLRRGCAFVLRVAGDVLTKRVHSARGVQRHAGANAERFPPRLRPLIHFISVVMYSPLIPEYAFEASLQAGVCSTVSVFPFVEMNQKGGFRTERNGELFPVTE